MIHLLYYHNLVKSSIWILNQGAPTWHWWPTLTTTNFKKFVFPKKDGMAVNLCHFLNVALRSGLWHRRSWMNQFPPTALMMRSEMVRLILPRWRDRSGKQWTVRSLGESSCRRMRRWSTPTLRRTRRSTSLGSVGDQSLPFLMRRPNKLDKTQCFDIG